MKKCLRQQPELKTYLIQFLHKSGNGYAIVNATSPLVAENVFKVQTKFEVTKLTVTQELKWFGLEMQLVTEGSVVTYGLSLYDLAVYEGFKGTFLEFMLSMKGPKGDPGVLGPQGPQGPPGKDGLDGKDGTDGKDGKDGRDGVDGKSALVITVTLDGTYSADTTFADILTAWNSGLDVIVYYSNAVYQVSWIDDGGAWFFRTDKTNAGPYIDYFAVDGTDDSWTKNSYNLLTRLTFDNVPTANSNNPVKSSGIYNMCPIIEDTRSSAVAAITGVAPFASLVDGQRIVLHVKYTMQNNSTLELTLSDGQTTTGAIGMWSSHANASKNTTFDTIYRDTYWMFVYDNTNTKWVMLGQRDTNTTYSSITQAEIDAGTSTSTRVVTPKILCDNFQKIRTVMSEEVTSNAVTITLDATKYHVPNDEVDTITMNLPSSYTAADEFILCFTCNSSSCTVNLPTGVVLADNCDNFSEVAAGVFFQVSIMNDVAAYLCVTPTTP